MQQLKVIGSEDDSLVLATEAGERFTLRADEVLRGELKRVQQRRERAGGHGPRPRPRDIQSRVRAGLSATQIAEALQITIEDVARYEGPVLAEREHIVDQALAVPVLVAGGLEDGTATFGAAVRAKLADAHAVSERWTSWKDEDGWTVKLEFTAADVDRDARWGFDPRRQTLAPLNADATQLSRQGALPDGLIPRLRALDAPAGRSEAQDDPAGVPEAAHASSASSAQDAAIKRAPLQAHTSHETADLLEALRRRRGQREPLPGIGEPAAEASAPLTLREAREPGGTPKAEPERPAAHAAPARDDAPAAEPRRKGRTAMPSWDEIVFGARSEEN